MTVTVSTPNAKVHAMLDRFEGDIEIVDWDIESPAPRDSIDVVITPFLSAHPNFDYLKPVTCGLVQTTSIGYDHVTNYLDDKRPLANAAGVHETATAEQTLALLLAVQRDIPRAVRSQDAGRWDQFFSPGLADKRIVMIGYGGVGKAIEARLEPFEVDLVRTASSTREDPKGTIYGPDRVEGLLPDADIVILIVPAIPQTVGMVDDAFLSKMKDGAVLCNMARGTIADTDALVRHADRLRICLDVVDPEPLPDEHPLYSHKNVLISAHTAGYTEAMEPRLERLLHSQLERVLAGQSPANLIDY